MPTSSGGWTPGEAAEALSPREGLGAPGKWGHLALCSSEIVAWGEQTVTTWDAGREDGGRGAAGHCYACPSCNIPIRPPSHLAVHWVRQHPKGTVKGVIISRHTRQSLGLKGSCSW